MANDYVNDGEEQGTSRRELIRRGAVVLGVGAWAVPLVQIVRPRGNGGGGDREPAPEEIGVRVVTSECLTCDASECGGFVICGSSGLFDCICAPSADAYPLAACICAEAGFCEDLTPCSEECPPGFACAQGCCDEPVCLPPCPEEVPFGPFVAEERRAARLTVSGTRV